MGPLDPHGPCPHCGTFASLVGASRVRVHQALVLLKRRGAITTDQGHRITGRDEEVLERAC